MEPVIETQKLTKDYGQHRGVVNLTMSINQGEIFGYLGPNGSGKTTTIRLLLHLVRPTAGKVLVFGKRVGWGGRSLRRRIGYFPGELGFYENYTALRCCSCTVT